MAIRKTSIEAYQKIRDSLSGKHQQIYDILYRSYTPLTAQEVNRLVGGAWFRADKRMIEMVRLDLIEECEARKCSVMEMNALTYTITGRPKQPQAKQPRRPSKQKILEKLEQAKEKYEYAYQAGIHSQQERFDGMIAALEWVLGDRKDLWDE